MRDSRGSSPAGRKDLRGGDPEPRPPHGEEVREPDVRGSLVGDPGGEGKVKPSRAEVARASSEHLNLALTIPICFVSDTILRFWTLFICLLFFVLADIVW